MDEGETDRNGNFDLEGNTRELTTIDPVLKIYHDCDDGIKVSIFVTYIQYFDVIKFIISYEKKTKAKFLSQYMSTLIDFLLIF